MILHPGILALLAGSILSLLMVGYAAALGVKILRRWDFQSSSAEQLSLERKTHLISTVVNYALGFEIISTLLFVYTLDDIHRLFVGAMCATGSLNANPVGWSALLVKLLIFFAASFWVVLNLLDQRSETCPLVRFKYRALLLLAPLLGLSLFLQFSYFLGLQPEIITSCCGALFSLGGSNVASDLAGLDVRITLPLFYFSVVILLVVLLLNYYLPHGLLRYLASFSGAAFFAISLVSIVSFISLYIYEMPTHHCPFDMLQRHYHYIGYPIYVGLFGGTLFSCLPGLFRPLSRIDSLRTVIARSEKNWLKLALFFLLLFTGIVTSQILFGPFKLFDY